MYVCYSAIEFSAATRNQFREMNLLFSLKHYTRCRIININICIIITIKKCVRRATDDELKNHRRLHLVPSVYAREMYVLKIDTETVLFSLRGFFLSFFCFCSDVVFVVVIVFLSLFLFHCFARESTTTTCVHAIHHYIVCLRFLFLFSCPWMCCCCCLFVISKNEIKTDWYKSHRTNMKWQNWVVCGIAATATVDARD